MNYLYTACAALIVFFILKILQKKDKTRADFLLILINIWIGLFMLADILVTQQFTSFRITLQNVLPLFLFPTFVWYVLQFIYSGKSIPKKWWFIWLPGLGLLIYSIIDHTLISQYDQEGLVRHFNQPYLSYQVFFKGSQILFILILFWILGQLKQFNLRIKDGYSEIETVSLSWLRNFSIIYLASIMLTFILFLLQNIGLLPMEIKQVFGIVYGALILSVFYLNYEGIQHYTLAQAYGIPSNIPTPPPNPNPNPNPILNPNLNPNTPITTEADQRLHREMRELLEEEQVYLTPKYGLGDLASDLGVSTHQLSKVINQLEEKNFYDFVNQYRVNHLKQLLSDPKKQAFTILTLGLESGFNSKASMNRIFKNFTGKTPRQFLQQRSQEA